MQHGYENVSLESIADACGVTKATVYYYFANKANLFTEAMTLSMRIARMQVERLLAQDKPVVDKLRDVAVAHLTNVRADPEPFMTESERHLSPKQVASIREASEGIHVAIADCFERLQSEGALSNRQDAFLLAHTYTAILTAGHREPIRERYGSVEAMADAVVALFWRGAAPD
ncbi:TetR/AcrR family transcriptional regulator [Paenibacillus sp. TRM 82003]|nr:TetR/AcrR family transcriptional regulator [Paenibacillus sp. TRM 82003]